MSRERLFVWATSLSSVVPPGSSVDVWDHVEGVMHPRWPNRTCQGGFSSGVDDSLSVYLYCNKTKARRVGDHLNRSLGVRGTVVPVVTETEDVTNGG